MPDERGYLLPEERRILLRRFAPVLVLFPETRAEAPYPDDGDAIYTRRGSYHPRAHTLFLREARVRYRWPVLLREPRLLWRPRSPEEERERARQSIDRDTLQRAVEAHRRDPRYTGLGEAALRAAVLAELVQRRLADRIRALDLPLPRGRNLKHWQAYFDLLDRADPQTRRATVYGRVVQGLARLGTDAAPPGAPTTQVSTYGPYDVSQQRVALQYWFHYYYDDWANRHEGDWESITLLLELDREVIGAGRELDELALLGGVTVQDVGYSTHEDGFRRLWPDVQKTADGRPIVYVARGSSASYFAWQLDGYVTSARVGLVERLLGWMGALLRGRRIFGRRWDGEYRARFTRRDPANTDWVAADPLPDDRADHSPPNRLERLVPPGCRGVRRAPDFGPDAGLDDGSYHLELDDLFWLGVVQQYGVNWGERFFLPGTSGPAGIDRRTRDRYRALINQLAQLEELVSVALVKLEALAFNPSGPIPELENALRPLRPAELARRRCLPWVVQPYVYTMWAHLLRSHPEAWTDGLSLWTRYRLSLTPRQGPLLRRDDPLFHLKALLAMIRRTRYETQHEGSKWDNPFAWVRYICLADTFYYGIAPPDDLTLDHTHLDCGAEG